MATCFVIQPFDGGTFDKRFEDVFEPAIKTAGLEAYRVDRDPNVTVPIDSIEEGIRSAAACLADITTDNPNVWYELGYSFAAARPVVMVCAEAERHGKKYPFDIQHRTIISYATGAPRDFEELKKNIVARLKALLNKTEALQRIGENQQVAPIEGLGQIELAVLAATAGGLVSPEEGISANSVKTDMERSGFTALAYSLGSRRLLRTGFIRILEDTTFGNEVGTTLFVTEEGWEWIDRNEGKFVLQRPPSNKPDEDLSF